jgi:hypothetical protein
MKRFIDVFTAGVEDLGKQWDIIKKEISGEALAVKKLDDGYRYKFLCEQSKPPADPPPAKAESPPPVVKKLAVAAADRKQDPKVLPITLLPKTKREVIPAMIGTSGAIACVVMAIMKHNNLSYFFSAMAVMLLSSGRIIGNAWEDHHQKSMKQRI